MTLFCFSGDFFFYLTKGPFGDFFFLGFLSKSKMIMGQNLAKLSFLGMK